MITKAFKLIKTKHTQYYQKTILAGEKKRTDLIFRRGPQNRNKRNSTCFPMYLELFFYSQKSVRLFLPAK